MTAPQPQQTRQISTFLLLLDINTCTAKNDIYSCNVYNFNLLWSLPGSQGTSTSCTERGLIHIFKSPSRKSNGNPIVFVTPPRQNCGVLILSFKMQRVSDSQVKKGRSFHWRKLCLLLCFLILLKLQDLHLKSAWWEVRDY